MSRPRSFAPGSPLMLLLLLAACAALCRGAADQLEGAKKSSWRLPFRVRRILRRHRGAPMADELRCQCQQTATRVIPPKHIAHVELIPEGLHCLVPEVIATMKNGEKVCLEPTAPWVKLIVKKILNRNVPMD